MISDAVELLLKAYNRDEEMADIAKKKEYVYEQLKFFTKKGCDIRAEEVRKIKNQQGTNNIIFLKRQKEYEIYKEQYDTYLSMLDDMMNYEKLLKKMYRSIRRIKEKYRDAEKMLADIPNLQIKF